MARPKVFDLSTEEGRRKLDDAYHRYLQPGMNLTTVAASTDGGHPERGVSPVTLSNAFREAGLPLKINRSVSAAQILREQRELQCPVDYLAARHNVTEATIYAWVHRHKTHLTRTGRGQSARWWANLLDSCEDLNDAFRMLHRSPHNIMAHRIPPLLHKRWPDAPAVVWILANKEEPARYVDEQDLKAAMAGTEPDENPFNPELFIGFADTCYAAKWKEDAPEDAAQPEEYESNVDGEHESNVDGEHESNVDGEHESNVDGEHESNVDGEHEPDDAVCDEDGEVPLTEMSPEELADMYGIDVEDIKQ